MGALGPLRLQGRNRSVQLRAHGTGRRPPGLSLGQGQEVGDQLPPIGHRGAEGRALAGGPDQADLRVEAVLAEHGAKQQGCRCVGLQRSPGAIHGEGRKGLMGRQGQLGHATDHGCGLIGIGALPMGRGEACGQQQGVHILQGQIERQGQPSDHLARRSRAAGLEEGDMALGDLGGQGEPQLREAPLTPQARDHGGKIGQGLDGDEGHAISRRCRALILSEPTTPLNDLSGHRRLEQTLRAAPGAGHQGQDKGQSGQGV